MICEVWEWSALTRTSVSGWVRWNSWATPMASSMPSSSPIWPQASAEWSRLSIEAPSTCSTKPFGLPWSSLIALSVISDSVGSVPRLAGVHLVVAEPAPAVGRDQRVELGRHVRVVEQAEQALARRERRDRVQLGLGRDVPVALVLRRVVDDVARAAGLQRLRVAGAAAAEDDVEPLVGLLLGDRAEAAGGLGLRRARGARVVRALAAALGDVRGRAGRRGVGDLGGRHVARGQAAITRDLHVGPVVGARHGDAGARALAEATVERLDAARTRRAAVGAESGT